MIKQLKEHPATSEFFAPSKTAVEDDAKETRPVPVLSLCDKDPRITQAREEIKLDSYAVSLRDFSTFDIMLVHPKLQTCFVLPA